ncbi:hypothetical protein CVT26_005494 [Gymnopilus dilepis]|uniref:Uncharacterized protein n=1 Tax=Gymnopilus dilepis TaxID=231916 RepID=A0A409YT37_9AGAR|nr:hypothetical protein CVT26_005494 [Gymnopilus dilepis]
MLTLSHVYSDRDALLRPTFRIREASETTPLYTKPSSARPSHASTSPSSSIKEGVRLRDAREQVACGVYGILIAQPSQSQQYPYSASSEPYIPSILQPPPSLSTRPPPASSLSSPTPLTPSPASATLHTSTTLQTAWATHKSEPNSGPLRTWKGRRTDGFSVLEGPTSVVACLVQSGLPEVGNQNDGDLSSPEPYLNHNHTVFLSSCP